MENNDNYINSQGIINKSQSEVQVEKNILNSDAGRQGKAINTESETKLKSRKTYLLYGVIVGLLSLAIIPIFFLLSIRTAPSQPAKKESINNASEDLGYSVNIYEPDNDAHIFQGDPILLKGGVVKTNVNDEFWQYNMTWTSDIQGFLGRGEDLTYKYLNPGNHKVTFSVESNSGTKSSAKINIVVKSDPSLNEPQLSQFLSECKKDNKYNDCLYSIIPKLAVWNKGAALELINENVSDKTLKSVYGGVIYDYAQTTFNSDLCAELTNEEFLEGCYVSIATNTKKPELCELAGSRVGNCYHWVASVMRDESYCPNADNPSRCAENVKNNIGKDPYFRI